MTLLNESVSVVNKGLASQSIRHTVFKTLFPFFFLLGGGEGEWDRGPLQFYVLAAKLHFYLLLTAFYNICKWFCKHGSFMFYKF